MQTQTVTVFGASDDLVEFVFTDFAARTTQQEFDLPYGSVWRGKLVAPDGAHLYVTAEYGAVESGSADWTVGVANGTGPFPDWRIVYGDRPGFEGQDPAVTIYVPVGTVIEEAR